MRFTITSSQLNYFRKEGQIEFEDLYTVEEALSLRAQLDQAQTVTQSERDLQRDHPPLMSALHVSRFGQLATNLFRKKRIRIAFTQYSPRYEAPVAIEAISSFSETLGGCIINLQSGVTTFYQAQFPIDFPSIAFPYLLIVLASDRARYKLQETDPCTHLLKRMGYGFGDLITEETHPLIVK